MSPSKRSERLRAQQAGCRRRLTAAPDPRRYALRTLIKMKRIETKEKKLNSHNDRLIVDANGNPIAPRTTWWERLRSVSTKVKIIIISVTAFVAIMATFLTNIEKIGNFLKGKENPFVPNIVVKLTNSSGKDVIVSARGDFILWLPGPDAYHTMGKYEFLPAENQSLTDGGIVVLPNKTVTVYAKIMNQKYYSKILSQSDCDLNLLVYRAGAGLTSTKQIPFTEEALRKYYIEVDVGK